MNSVTLTGRLVRDPQIRYASQSQMAVANFTLAVDRVRTRSTARNRPRIFRTS